MRLDRLAHTRTLGLAVLLAAGLLAAPSTEVALATCGGGGGGGAGGAGKAYETKWKGSLAAALKAAEAEREGVVVYFQPVREEEEHRFFQTKIPSEASKERPFVKIGGDARKLRAEYQVKDALHTVMVCDWFGNDFKRWQGRAKTKFKGKAVRDVLYKMHKLVKKLAKKLDTTLASAEKAAARQSYPGAIKSTNQILVYKGYDAVAGASALRNRIEAVGQTEVEKALLLEEPQRKKRLQLIRRKFKGTKVETRCDEELGKVSLGPVQAGDAVARAPAPAEPALAEQVWAETFGHIDYDALPPTLAERVDEAMRRGLAHENASRYEEALEQYALAAGLDVTDPVPLAFLGELYRHHLGDWKEARKVFERVIELDADDHAVAIALHGIGKMTIWTGDNEKGLDLLRRSIERRPTALCYRNLAVYWNTEGDAKKAFAYGTSAYELDPGDAYNQVFYSVYLLMNGQGRRARKLMARAKFDPSMSYNYACFHAVQGNRKQALSYLRRHFNEYERYDAVRSFEMAEARMDAFFAPWYDDPEFRQITALAGKTPWLEGDR